MKRSCWWVSALVMAVASISTAQETAPATMPGIESKNVVANGKFAVHFSIWQGGKEVLAEKDGVVHLKRSAFEMRFTGDVGQAAILAAHSPDVFDALAKAQLPVVSVVGMGAAQEKDELLFQDGPDGAKLESWDKFTDDLGKEEGEKYAVILKAKLKAVPLVLDGGLQYLRAEDGAKSFTLKVNSLMDGDFAKDKGFQMAVMETAEVDGEMFVSLKWCMLKVVFDP